MFDAAKRNSFCVKIKLVVNLRFWRPKEKFLLLEIKPQKSSGLFLSVDEEKNIGLEKVWDNSVFEKYRKSKTNRLLKRKIIVSADPSLAATVSFPVELKREQENYSQPISAVELENLLSQAIGRVFNNYRGEVAAKFGLPEMETVLVGSEADNFKVDNHLVLNPLAFQGKSAQAILRLTFTARHVFEPLKNLFGTRDFFFTTSPKASLFLLSRVYAPPLNLIVLSDKSSDCFILDKAAWGHALYDKKIDWSLGSISSAIESQFSVNCAVASKLYANYLGKDMSDGFYAAFSRVIRSEVENLATEIKKLKTGGKIFMHSSLPLPANLSVRLGHFSFDSLPLNEALNKAGFRLDLACHEMPANEAFTRLAPFFEFYYDKSNSEINRRLNRRLHWLAE
jgi:hypothetical protein